MDETKKLLYLLILSLISRVELSQDVMKSMSVTFAKPLEVCRKELELPETVTSEFSNFWKDGYEIVDRQTGCAILCMASKLELLDTEYNIHHKNAHEYAKKHGADDVLAQKLVDLLHGCIASTVMGNDPCMNTLAVAKCFKIKIHELDWTPNMDIVMAEVLAEV